MKRRKAPRPEIALSSRSRARLAHAGGEVLHVAVPHRGGQGIHPDQPFLALGRVAEVAGEAGLQRAGGRVEPPGVFVGVILEGQREVCEIHLLYCKHQRDRSRTHPGPLKAGPKGVR